MLPTLNAANIATTAPAPAIYPSVVDLLGKNSVEILRKYAQSGGRMGAMYDPSNPYTELKENSKGFERDFAQKQEKLFTPEQEAKLRDAKADVTAAEAKFEQKKNDFVAKKSEKLKDINREVLKFTNKRSPYAAQRGVAPEDTLPDVPREERLKEDMAFNFFDTKLPISYISTRENISQREVDGILNSPAQQAFNDAIAKIEAEVEEATKERDAKQAELNKATGEVYKATSGELVQKMTDFLFASNQVADVFIRFESPDHVSHILGFKELDIKTKEGKLLVVPVIGAKLNEKGEVSGIVDILYMAQSYGAQICSLSSMYWCQGIEKDPNSPYFTVNDIRKDKNVSKIPAPLPSQLGFFEASSNEAGDAISSEALTPEEEALSSVIASQEAPSSAALASERASNTGGSWWQLPAAIGGSAAFAGVLGYILGSRKQKENPYAQYIIGRLDDCEAYIKSELKRPLLGLASELYELNNKELKTLADTLYIPMGSRGGIDEAVEEGSLARTSGQSTINEAEKQRVNNFFEALDSLRAKKADRTSFLSGLTGLYGARTSREYTQPTEQAQSMRELSRNSKENSQENSKGDSKNKGVQIV